MHHPLTIAHAQGQGCLQDAAQTADVHVVFGSSAGHRHQDTWRSMKAMDLDMAHSRTRTRSSLRSEVAEQATNSSMFLAGSTGPRHEPDNGTGRDIYMSSGHNLVLRHQPSLRHIRAIDPKWTSVPPIHPENAPLLISGFHHCQDLGGSFSCSGSFV